MILLTEALCSVKLVEREFVNGFLVHREIKYEVLLILFFVHCELSYFYLACPSWGNWHILLKEITVWIKSVFSRIKLSQFLSIEDMQESLPTKQEVTILAVNF